MAADYLVSRLLMTGIGGIVAIGFRREAYSTRDGRGSISWHRRVGRVGSLIPRVPSMHQDQQSRSTGVAGLHTVEGSSDPVRRSNRPAPALTTVSSTLLLMGAAVTNEIRGEVSDRCVDFPWDHNVHMA